MPHVIFTSYVEKGGIVSKEDVTSKQIRFDVAL